MVVVVALEEAVYGLSMRTGTERQLTCLFMRMTKAGPCPIMPPAQSFREESAKSSAHDVCFQRAINYS